ncbi:MAG: dihydroorotate dehydrogenase electron transfer subunit [Catenisphaera adipataccumulans]|jgi:dihydroorotate dehydrogenase electron transfer subunit|uniref:dihydroorotate dehydrogenase electron transfer subunit n=1 Tax=Catenisphaera adipataccumulans TaxID=700500 RepID=UPI003D8B27C1
MIMIEDAVILTNVRIAPDIYRMELKCTMKAEPGQFVQVQVPGTYLRRPISICEVTGSSLVLIYKVVGKGTAIMAELGPGRSLNIFGPLGTGFPIEAVDAVVLAGGGVGIPPLYETAKRYRTKQTNVTVVLGFNQADQIFYADAFEKLGCTVKIATMDGSVGTKGTVMEVLKTMSVPMIEACGPLPMLKAIQEAYPAGYISLEARMACGMGACMGCVVKDQNGQALRVCKDGPVFPIGKVVLE